METAPASAQPQPQQEDEQYAAEVNIWKMVYGLHDSLVIRFSIEIGIPDIIHAHGAPITLSELATHISDKNSIPSVYNNGGNYQNNNSVDLDSLRRIMRFLVDLKLVSATPVPGAGAGQLRYELEPAAAKLLVKGSDSSIAPVVLMMTEANYILGWQNLKECLREKGSGRATPFEKAVGKSIWDYYAGDPAMGKLFDQAMAYYSRMLAPALIRECRETFAGAGSVIDVGGGTGTTMRAVAQAFPHLKCTVFDLPRVVEESPNYPNVGKVGGDMFDFIPTADVVLLKWILHDWDDDKSIQILKRCKEAVPREGGKVIIIDIILDSEPQGGLVENANYLKSATDLDMLTFAGGQERTEEEWKNIIHEAGFATYKTKHMESIYSVIEAYPSVQSQGPPSF